MGWSYKQDVWRAKRAIRIREQARAELQPKPVPTPKKTTIAGVSHSLSWLDRHPSDEFGPLPMQRRMRCSCGWVDPSNRLSDASAINHANAHITAIQSADAVRQRSAVRKAATARAAAQREAAATRKATRSSEKRRRDRRGAVVAVLIIAAVIAAIAVPVALHKPNSYNDGRQWAQEQEQSTSSFGTSGDFPGCSRAYMVASTTDNSVVNFNFIAADSSDVDFYGAGEPGDNYSQWRAGCESTDNTGLLFNTLPNNGNNVQHMKAEDG